MGRQRRSRISPYLLGIASLFDFLNVLAPPRRRLELPTVYEALSADWKAVGSDIAHAMQRYAHKHPEVLR
jgi:hypothetical protein